MASHAFQYSALSVASWPQKKVPEKPISVLRFYLAHVPVKWHRLVRKAWLVCHALRSPQIATSTYYWHRAQTWVRSSIQPYCIESLFYSSVITCCKVSYQSFCISAAHLLLTSACQCTAHRQYSLHLCQSLEQQMLQLEVRGREYRSQQALAK